MKLADKKKITIIAFSIIGGLIFAGYILYVQGGQIGKTEIISLSIAALISIIILVLIIRRANK
jgi:hypothetical protein